MHSPFQGEPWLLALIPERASPATIEDHVTLGASWAYSAKMETSFSYMHGFQSEIVGDNKINLSMSQEAFGMGWGWKI